MSLLRFDVKVNDDHAALLESKPPHTFLCVTSKPKSKRTTVRYNTLPQPASQVNLRWPVFVCPFLSARFKSWCVACASRSRLRSNRAAKNCRLALKMAFCNAVCRAWKFTAALLFRPGKCREFCATPLEAPFHKLEENGIITDSPYTCGVMESEANGPDSPLMESVVVSVSQKNLLIS